VTEVKSITARSEISIEHGPGGYSVSFGLVGRTVAIRGDRAIEVLSKAGEIIDDVWLTLAAHAEKNVIVSDTARKAVGHCEGDTCHKTADGRCHCRCDQCAAQMRSDG
jgi:hypothetical protein